MLFKQLKIDNVFDIIGKCIIITIDMIKKKEKN